MIFSFGGSRAQYQTESGRPAQHNANISMSEPNYKGAGEPAGLSDCLCRPFVDAIERAAEKLHHHRFEK
jgi:hypothetical protein